MPVHSGNTSGPEDFGKQASMVVPRGEALTHRATHGQSRVSLVGPLGP